MPDVVEHLARLPFAELLLLLMVTAVTTVLTRRVLPVPWQTPGLLLIPLASFGLGTLYWSLASAPPDVLAQTYIPPRSDDRGYVSSQTCRSCHPGEYASWHKTYHRTMTQVAAPSTVVPGAQQDFDDRHQLETHGQSARLSRRDDEFWVDMVNPEWDKAQAAGIPEALAVDEPPRSERRVMLTTGSHHFQVFWITSDRTGELWQFPWRYHIGEDRWVHRNDVFLQPPDKPALSHFRTWNHQCIHCHTTGGEPGLGPPPQNIFSKTRVGEIGIACESCHGPAEDHVRKYQDLGRRLKQHVTGDTPDKPPIHHVVNPATTTPRLASQVCGQCHSHMVNHDNDSEGSRNFLKTGLAYRPGDDLDQFARFLKLDDGFPGNQFRFWADGNCRSGGREYNGLLGSPCYQVPAGTGDHSRQMSCLSCHSMHNAPANDQLIPAATSNASCTTCHPKFRQTAALEAHTHHRAQGDGSRCYNCHMPHTSYALFKAIRSHQIDSPRVTATGPNTRPNACNLCHLDRTLGWTSEHLTRWYDQPRVKLPESDQNAVSAALGWLLTGDAGQRVIAAWHFGWGPAIQASGKELGTDWIVPRLAHVLDDPYPAVRWVGWQSLKAVPGVTKFDYDFDGTAEHRRMVIRKLLGSPGRAVPGRPQILSRPNGRLDQKRLEELLRLRDDRMVEIYE